MNDYGEPWKHKHCAIVTNDGETILLVPGGEDCKYANHAVDCVNLLHAASIANPAALEEFVEAAIAVRLRAKEMAVVWFDPTVGEAVKTREIAIRFDSALAALREEEKP